MKALDSVSIDETGVALARRYARDIDEAEVLTVAAAKMARDLRPFLNNQQYDALMAQLARIEETAVLALLGPKLVQVLAELGMTPRARADVTGKGGRGNEPPKNAVAAWRAERGRHLKGVDAS